MLKSLLYCLVLLTILPLINCSNRTKLGDFMMYLDRNISEVINNPTLEQGESLLYVLDEYITHMRDVNHLLRFNTKFMYKTAKQLYKEGSPTFLSKDIDLNHLHEVFQWEDFKTEAIGDYLNGIKNYTLIFRDMFPELSESKFDKYDYESAE